MARLSKEKYVKNIQYEINVVENLGLSNKNGKNYYRIEQTAGHIDETLYSGKRLLLFGENGVSFWFRYWKFSIANRNDNETSLSDFVTIDDPNFTGNANSFIGKTLRYYTQILVEHDNEVMSETDVMSRLVAEESKPQPTIITGENSSHRFLNPLGDVDGGRRGLIEADELSKLRRLKRNVMFWNDVNTLVTDGTFFTVCIAKLDNTDSSESIDIRFSSYLINTSFTVHVNKIYASMNNNANVNYDITKLQLMEPDGYNGAITVDYFDVRMEDKGGMLSVRPVLSVKATIEKYAATGNTMYVRIECKVDFKNKDGNQGTRNATITLGAKDIKTLSYYHENVKQKESAGADLTKSIPLKFFYPSYRMSSENNIADELINKNSNKGEAEIDEWTLGFTSGRRVSIPRPSELMNTPEFIVSGDLNNFKSSGYYWTIGNASPQNPTIKNVPVRFNGTELLPITDSFRLEVQNLDGYDNNALLYSPLYAQIYGEEINFGKLKTSFVLQRLVSLTAKQSVVTQYDDNGNPSLFEEAPYIYERLYIKTYGNGNETWTAWNEVGRKNHLHKLEELAPSPKSLHFSQEIKDQITGAVGTIKDSPFVSEPIANPYAYTGKDGNVFISSVTDANNGLGIKYGIYQKQESGVIKRIDIGALTLLTPTTNPGSLQTDTIGAISKELFVSLIGSQFLKNIATDGTKQAFVFCKNDGYNGNENIDVFDIVNRSGNNNLTLAEKSISFGFGNTQANGPSSIAIGVNVVSSSSSNVIMIGSDISGVNGRIGIGTGLDMSNTEYVFGRFNASKHRMSGETVVFALGNGRGPEENNRQNIFEIAQNGIIGVNGVKKFDFVVADGQDIEKIAFNVNGGTIDISEYAEKSVVEELDRNKVDIGSNFVTRFIGENGIPYDMVSATDSDVEVQNYPADGKILYSPGNYLIFPEGFRIDFLETEVEDEKDEAQEYIEIYVPGTISSDNKVRVFTCMAEYNVDEETQDVTTSYSLIDFANDTLYKVDYSKIPTTNPVHQVNLNEGLCILKNGDRYIFDQEIHDSVTIENA